MIGSIRWPIDNRLLMFKEKLNLLSTRVVQTRRAIKLLEHFRVYTILWSDSKTKGEELHKA